MDASPDQAEQFEDGNATVIPLPGAPQPQNFPRPRTSFIGRRRALAELRQQLDSARLLTLTVAGGFGKTRLAIQAASEARERFPDGVWWVELAPLAEEKLVGAAIAEALEVRPLPGMTPLQAACAYLASRRSMVILDNCEHLLRASAEAADALLNAAPDVVVLATTRAPLGVALIECRDRGDSIDHEGADRRRVAIASHRDDSRYRGHCRAYRHLEVGAARTG